MSPEIRDNEITQRPVGFQDLKIFDSVDKRCLMILQPELLYEVPEIVMYEPKKKIELWPNLDTACFLINRKNSSGGEKCLSDIYPSSEGTLGGLFYRPRGFSLSILLVGSDEERRLVVKAGRVLGHQGFGRLWVLAEEKLALYRADLDKIKRAILRTADEKLVLIPKLIGWPGLILTTDKEVKKAGGLEVIMNILNS